MGEAKTFKFFSGSLEEHGKDVWSLEGTVKSSLIGPAWMGALFPIRMFVVRLQTGKLLLVSPFPLDQELTEIIDSLGSVAYILAPNGLHHLWAAGCKKQYSSAILMGPPRCKEKASDAAWDIILPEEAVPSELSEDCDFLMVEGFHQLQEVVVLHRPTGTLMVADLAFNMQRGHPRYDFQWPWSLIFRLAAGYRPCNIDHSFYYFCEDPHAAKKCLDTILAWDFDRLLMAHGLMVGTGGKEALRNGTYATICGWAANCKPKPAPTG